MIDVDTMVRWDCPNIFELSEGRYTGVKDDLSIEWVYNSINGYKKFFPDVDLDWTEYINNGVLVLPKDEGEEFCKSIIDFYQDNINELRDMQNHTLKKGTDQTPVNYFAKKTFGDDINYLSKKYNMSQMLKTDVLIDNIHTKCSYIWHFNSIPRDQRNGIMRHTWDVIKENYND